MASRKELIEEFNNVQTTYRELEYSLYKKYIIIVRKHRDNEKKLHQYLDECPDCSSKLMFYQALRELDERNQKKARRKRQNNV